MQLARRACASDRLPTNNQIHQRVAVQNIYMQHSSIMSTTHTCARRRTSRCFGILDSYRKEQAAKQQKADNIKQHQNVDLGGVQMLVYDSVDEDTCPAECVTEIYSAQDFKQICQDANQALVVVDFYKTSCGACKYMMNGFFKLCKATYSADEHPDVIFLKHNVYNDELGETTDLAQRLTIRGVPKFMLFRDMQLLEEFSTREQRHLIEAVRRHADIDHFLEE
eukprot:jgi/Ulvmu1/6146/UM028_0002.1